MIKRVTTGFAVALLCSTVNAQTAIQYKPNKDPLTDKDTSYVTVPGQADSTRELLWRCDGSDLDVIFSHNKLLRGGVANYIQVKIRFPPDPLFEGIWEASSNARAVLAFREERFKPEGRKPDMVNAFTKRALAAATVQPGIVVLRVINDSMTSEVTETFSLVGLPEALKQLSCARSLLVAH